MDRISRLWPAVLVVVGIVAVAIFAWRQRSTEKREAAPAPSTPRPMGLPLPVLVDADGDGDEDLLIGGRLVDGATWATRWSVPEILQVVGRRAVAVHGRTIKVFDLQSGRETGSTELTADMATTCVEGTKLVVRQSDGVTFTYEPTSGSRSEAVVECHPSDRPPMCANAKADCSLVGTGNLRLSDPPLDVQIVFDDRGASLVALDAKGAERFREVIDSQGRRISDLDLVGKRVFVFQDGVRAFDATTGKLAWRNDAGKRMRVGEKHVYVSLVRDGGPALDVLDARTGDLVTTLLRE